MSRLTYRDASGAVDEFDERDAEHYPRPDARDVEPGAPVGHPGPLADAFRAAVARVRSERSGS